MREHLVIGARGSALSRAQAGLVCRQLARQHPDRQFEIVAIASRADQQPEAPLTALGGGEGVFVKELEAALFAGTIDLAIHSLKDLPLAIPHGLAIGAVTAREDARDAFISRGGVSFESLPGGSRIGTSSPRRRSQLLWRRKDVVLEDMRGNVDTRLRKLDEGRYDAIVLASAGLIRLGMAARITEHFSCDVMLPEPGQGALAIEVRADDDGAREVAGSVHDEASSACVEAERAFLDALGGGCHLPIAAYAEAHGGGLLLRGAVIALDGSKKIDDHVSGRIEDAIELGQSLGRRVLDAGARDLL